MKKKKQMRIVKRRRHEGKTNYSKRLKLLKGGHIRLVVRKSNRYLVLQIVESVHAQDKVLFTVTTKDLLKYGWPSEKAGSLKSLGAGYLGGMLLGKRTEGKVDGKVILDSGLIPNTKGSRVYAVVKGLKNGGVDIEFSEEVVPPMEKIEKQEFFKDVKGKIGGGN